MKKAFLKSVAFLLVFFSMLVPGTCVFGDDALTKLGRGAANILTSPFELTNQMQKEDIQNGPFAGLTIGLIKGVLMTGVRAAVGVYEIASFVMPLPRIYGPVLKDPEYFLEDSLV